MEFYDIELNFNDYPFQIYDWSNKDNIDRLLKILVIRIEDIKDVLEYNVLVDLNDGKYILSDTINSIGIEVIDKKVVYLSYLKYDVDNFICDKVSRLDIKDINIIKLDKRVIDNSLRSDIFIKRVLINLVNTSDNDCIKYIYYDVTNKVCNDINKCKRYLIKDINNNLNKYYNFYEMLFNK